MILGGPLADNGRVALAVEADSEESVRTKLALDGGNHRHLRVDSIDRWAIALEGRSSGRMTHDPHPV